MFTMGSKYIESAQREIGAPPTDLAIENVAFTSASGATIRGWLVPGPRGGGTILLFHGVRSDRRSMLPRARMLHELGYTSLLIDFQAHGESTGQHITFGALETRDAEAAAAFAAQRRPGEPLGAIGVSMGGAAILLARQPLPLQAAVLESVYPTIEEAVGDRLTLRLGSWASILSPLLLMQLEPRLGITPEALRPISRIGTLHSALLLAHGAQDRHTTLEEADRLFAAANAPKQRWVVDGAAHADLYAFAPEEYRARIGAFFRHTLGMSSDIAMANRPNETK